MAVCLGSVRLARGFSCMKSFNRFISVGESIPSVQVKLVRHNEVQDVNSGEYLKGKKIVLFGVPGAFTPVCSEKHLPEYVMKERELRTKSVDEVICLTVNDFFVVKEWAKVTGAENISFFADGNAALTKSLDLALDASGFGMGVRSKRFSALVQDGVVTKLNVEPDGAGYSVSSATEMLSQLS